MEIETFPVLIHFTKCSLPIVHEKGMKFQFKFRTYTYLQTRPLSKVAVEYLMLEGSTSLDRFPNPLLSRKSYLYLEHS